MDHRLTALRAASAVAILAFLAACSDKVTGPAAPAAPSSSRAIAPAFDRGGDPGGEETLENAAIHPTVEAMDRIRRGFAHGGNGGASTGNDLYYHGGVGGIGVETSPRVYIVFWGAQWSNDPSSEATLVQNFLKGVGGSKWLNSVTQYCQGVASGTVTCGSSGQHAGNPSSDIVIGVWFDNGSNAPSRPRQSQLASEAVRAAGHFGNTAAGSNSTAQYVIATAHGASSSGFGSQYCAYHSSTSSSYGTIAYTNLPYITDAGASCGANFNNLGAKAGITIVEGHELAETITDQFPNGGWLDSGGAENGDKCAWITSGQGASANVTIGTGTYPVQSLWSNAFNSGAGGCVLSY